MNAIHFKTVGMHCDQCPFRIESALGCVPGVKCARAYWHMGLTSVLFDPDLVDPETIRARIESSGFRAEAVPRA